MNTKTTKILYWVFLSLFLAFSVFDSIGGITKQAAGVEIVKHLGYPVYFMQFMGVAKLLGAVTIAQRKFNTLRQWAYAGFAFTFIGACISRAASGDGVVMSVLPLVFFAFMLVPYFLERKLNAAKTQPVAVNRFALA